VVHATCSEEGIEVLSIRAALEKYDWIRDYYWNVVPKDKDEITKYVAGQEDPKGYFIIARKGSSNILPVQACLYLGREQIQHVHNIIIAEEGAELHIISGCASGHHVGTGGAHYGISEFYVGKNAKISFTMIHTWGEGIEVFPRSASRVEENGVFLSNYVCMQPVRKVQMYPTAHLVGENSVARFSSVVIASPGSSLDLGSRAILGSSGASAELITRAITLGGTIISRGHIQGRVTGTRGHLECKGLILKDGTIYAIPEIEGLIVGTELSHEAAVGKLAREEIEYLMARGLDEEVATATIIRGFLDVKIAGLPSALQQQIDATIDTAESGF
jgi:Fe-S cluster assembly scaffold protein SufB